MKSLGSLRRPENTEQPEQDSRFRAEINVYYAKDKYYLGGDWHWWWKVEIYNEDKTTRKNFTHSPVETRFAKAKTESKALYAGQKAARQMLAEHEHRAKNIAKATTITLGGRKVAE